MDDQMHATPTADMELEQRLDAYARARLSLAPDTTARIRKRVMQEAQRTIGAAGAVPGLSVVGARSVLATGNRTRARFRRGGALLLAAGLAVGVLGGTAAAAQPGGPLYGSRVWVEQVTLPADPTERAAAELRRLEARLTDIEGAASSGDQGAVAAAIAAYSQIADEALDGAGTDATLLDLLRIALDRHLAVLQAVAATAPLQAQEAIQRNIDRAVERNDATLEKIVSRTSSPNANQGGGGSQGGGPNSQPAQSQKPLATPAPAATPDESKKPHPTAKPDATPEPTPALSTPAPTPDPTVRPGGGKPSPKPSQDTSHTNGTSGK
jgi:hypothetical protein